VVRWRAVTFAASVDNAQGAVWRWTLTAADGTVVHTGSAAVAFTVTPPAGHGTSFVITLEVAGPGGAATPVSRSVDTTSEVHPQLSDLSATTTEPAQGELVTFSATEPVAGARGTWTWTVTDIGSGARVFGPQPRQAQLALPYTFDTPGRYRTTLTVSYDGAESTKSIDVTVSAAFDVLVDVTGPGSVTGAGLTCAGTRCAGRFRAGATVVATAVPAGAGARFTGWSGCPSAAGDRCTVVVGGTTTVGAAFDRVPDRSRPEVTLTGAGRTVRVGSPGEGFDGSSVTVQADGADAESPVTRIEIWVSYSYSCIDSGGNSYSRSPLTGRPSAAADGPSVSYPLDVTARSWCGGGYTLVKLSASIKAKATSAGGTAETGSLTMTYRP
jgi:hypothetical protein